MSEAIQLFEKQKTVYPRRVWGRYRKIKWVAMVVLLAIYYLAPFLRYNRGPHAPNQAILIDIPHERLYFFFIEIWPQEVYYLTGILVLAAIGLFFVTALFGRVWCGYTCPQTVWTDLFVWVERIIQGDRNKRMKLSEGPLTFEKIWKKSITHFIWIIIGVMTGGAWVFYFNDAPTLWDNILIGHVSSAVLLWIIGLTFSTYIMAGYAREQVCAYMCPYGRFQSAMFDKDTLIITYDEQRGEPRGKHKQGESWEGRGDCIDCDSCVVVCPVGIDIREGLQSTCIACGLCVDACNNVMDKVGRPRGLIRYDTENNQLARRKALSTGQKFNEWIHLVRPRTIYYTVVLVAVGVLMLYGLLTRAPVELHALHDRNPMFVKLVDGRVRNNYTIKILNESDDTHVFRLTIPEMPDATIKMEGAGGVTPDHIFVNADEVGEYRVMVSAVPQDYKASRDITFRLDEVGGSGEHATRGTMFVMSNARE